MKRSYFSIATVLLLTVCCFTAFTAARAQSAPPQTDEDRVYSQSEVDKKPQFPKPHPSPNGQCKMNTSGTILFNLVLRRSGIVEIISVPQTSGCEYFDRVAYNAIRDLKFDPAEKDGHPVSMKITMTLTYSVY